MSKQEWSKPSMLLVTSNWQHLKSFSLMPIDKDCPYVEALYNPDARLLAVIGKTTKDTFHMVPRLDDSRKPINLKVGATEAEPFKKQRIQQESYTEYYIIEPEEIEGFIKGFAVNHADFDYKSVMDMERMSGPDTIATGAQLLSAND